MIWAMNESTSRMFSNLSMYDTADTMEDSVQLYLNRRYMFATPWGWCRYEAWERVWVEGEQNEKTNDNMQLQLRQWQNAIWWNVIWLRWLWCNVMWYVCTTSSMHTWHEEQIGTPTRARSTTSWCSADQDQTCDEVCEPTWRWKRMGCD